MTASEQMEYEREQHYYQDDPDENPRPQKPNSVVRPKDHHNKQLKRQNSRKQNKMHEELENTQHNFQ